MEEYLHKNKVSIFLAICGVVLAGLIVSEVLSPEPPVVSRPIDAITVSRDCDFVTVNSMILAVCQDGSQWDIIGLENTPMPTALPTPMPTPTLEPVSQSGSDKLNPVQLMLASVAAKPVEAMALDASDIPTETVEAYTVEQGVATAAPIEPVGVTVTAKYSWYNPALGGTNCFSFVGGVCISKMSSGKPWLPYMNVAVACVPEWPFGTIVVFNGKEHVCYDRGGAIKTINGVPWIDFLTRVPEVPFGTLIDVQVIFP